MSLLLDTNVCAHSPRWERREAGEDITHPRLGMKGGVGDILPTLPQSPRRHPNPPAPPQLLLPHRTHPKTTARKQQQEQPPRWRRQRPEAGRRKLLRQINEALLLGVSLDRRDAEWGGSSSSELSVRSFQRRTVWVWRETERGWWNLIGFISAFHFKASIGSELESVCPTAHIVYKGKNAFPAFCLIFSQMPNLSTLLLISKICKIALVCKELFNCDSSLPR